MSVLGMNEKSSTDEFDKIIEDLLHHPLARDVRCDAIMRCLAQEAVNNREDWGDKFVSLDWRMVENYDASDHILLVDALNHTLNFTLTNHDAQILINAYQTPKKTFDYRAFLKDFFIGFERCGHEMGTEEVNTHRTGKEMWQLVRQKLRRRIEAVQTFKVGASEKARQRALQQLMIAIGRIQVSRFAEKTIHFTGSLNKAEFRR